MLVLSRRIGEAIVVGGNIRIVVLSVTGNSVRFGVEAPRAISVHREEVLKQIDDLDTTEAAPPARSRRPHGG
ncbi:MAG: carbon storage regulator CsrA [Pseudomonadota bacterium]